MSASTDTRLALLSAFGWTIEQENPLHIRHSPSFGGFPISRYLLLIGI